MERSEGALDSAVVGLQKVAAVFPRSPDAHRELGFSYYQQQKYELARAEYETVQAIEPDDLSAHYYLSIVYRRDGDKRKGAAQAALFSDEKDDPTANTTALRFLRSQPELADDNVPWHLHKAHETGASQ